MIYVLGRVAIEDIQTFVGVFATRGAAVRQQHGSRWCQLYRVSEEENHAVLLFAWESREAFEGFLNDPAVRETMQSSGTVGRPEFTILHKIGEFPG